MVCKVEDIELGRFVALKFVPVEVAHDPQALERFRREARAASSLNHPNICTICAIGTNWDQSFLVMDYLDGITLKYRIGGRWMEADSILTVSLEIADSLDAAHTVSIVHRDIKPANIFVTKRGHATFLDFGLANVAQPIGGSGEASQAAGQSTVTLEEHLTSSGSAVGSIAYMSPEHVRAKELGARSDLFSFGAVLLWDGNGSVAFSGRMLGSDLQVPPRFRWAFGHLLRARLPGIIVTDHLQVLEKDRNLRYQSAADVRAELQRFRRDSSSGMIPDELLPSRSSSGCDPTLAPGHISVRARLWSGAACSSVSTRRSLASRCCCLWLQQLSLGTNSMERPPFVDTGSMHIRPIAGNGEVPAFAAVSVDGKLIA